MDAGNEAVIAEILLENSKGVFRGQVGMISMRVPLFTTLGLIITKLGIYIAL